MCVPFSSNFKHVQSKLHLAKCEFISVSSTHDQTSWHDQAIFTCFIHILCQTYGQMHILCWLFVAKNINKQPYCQQKQLLGNVLMMCSPIEHHWTLFYWPLSNHKCLKAYPNHHLPNKLACVTLADFAKIISLIQMNNFIVKVL